MSGVSDTEFIAPAGRQRIAYHWTEGRPPTVVFLGGFLSDMEGSKAIAFEAYCRQRGQAYLRLDYSGHGESAGAFEDGTISSWRDDALAVIDAVTAGPLLVIGSSMGGWLALLVALALRDRVVGLIGLAAAPDFTEELMWGGLDAGQKQQLEGEGMVSIPSAYESPYPITRALIEDGRDNLLMTAPIDLYLPVHLVQGSEDPDVPAEMPGRIAERLSGEDVQITIIDGGGHSLSRPQDIETLLATLGAMLDKLKFGIGRPEASKS